MDKHIIHCCIVQNWTNALQHKTLEGERYGAHVQVETMKRVHTQCTEWDVKGHSCEESLMFNRKMHWTHGYNYFFTVRHVKQPLQKQGWFLYKMLMLPEKSYSNK